MESLSQIAKEGEIQSNKVSEIDFVETAQTHRALAAGPLLVDSKTAAALIGVGISTFYAMDRSGELGPPGLRLRRRRLWPREELAAWVRCGCPARPRWLALQEGRKRD